MPANPTPAEGVVVVPLEILQRAHMFIEDCAFNGELQPTSDSENPCELATDLAAMLAARPAAPTQSAAQTGEVERLMAALREIAEIEPKPFDGGLDMEAIRSCAECQRYKGHPVQRGICNTHRRPIWDREKHEGHEERVLGYRAKALARDALSQPEQSQ